MKNWTPEIEAQLERHKQMLVASLLAAFISKHGKGNVLMQNVRPTEFDREYRWWIEPIGPRDQPNNWNWARDEDIERYYSLTNLPPDKAMLVQTISGDTVEFMFAPKIEPAPKSSKPKGFGK